MFRHERVQGIGVRVRLQSAMRATMPQWTRKKVNSDHGEKEQDGKKVKRPYSLFCNASTG